MAQQKPFESPAIIRPGIVPELGPMPSPADMAGMSNADLSELLRRHGVAEPWESLVARGARYNAAFMRMPPTSELALRERALAMYAPEAKGGLLRLARRTQERYTTVEAIDGDVGAILVRICELDDNSCSGCESLAGFEGTIADHEGAGLPGEQECGGNCRCQLVRVEGGGAASATYALIVAAAAAAVISEARSSEPADDEESDE